MIDLPLERRAIATQTLRQSEIFGRRYQRPLALHAYLAIHCNLILHLRLHLLSRRGERFRFQRELRDVRPQSTRLLDGYHATRRRQNMRYLVAVPEGYCSVES